MVLLKNKGDKGVERISKMYSNALEHVKVQKNKKGFVFLLVCMLICGDCWCGPRQIGSLGILDGKF